MRLDKLAPFFPQLGPAWTAGPPLPGGDMPDGDFDRFLENLKAAYPWLPPDLAHHYARSVRHRDAYSCSTALGSLEDLGTHHGARFYEREAAYLRDVEWADTAEDILDRRTKHGLALTADERASVRGRPARTRRAQAGLKDTQPLANRVDG